ncbi:helix-turn-helix domain-containing protein [Natrinema sp. HArc-T2]|uniref:helix-turn-helix domain-containing protein n=1 Tax=Natrinema sp. HArc-T2 TaxID=3242701 RepID=UPI00359D8835
MLLTTFRIDYPILRTALTHASDIEITWERSDLIGDGTHRMLVWADGPAFGTFESGLEADPTVKSPTRVIEFDERRLYQLELTAEGRRASVYPTVVETGAILQDATATDEGWDIRAALPDEETLDQYHTFFMSRDFDVELKQLYEDWKPSYCSQPRFGLTDRQHEILVAAVDEGYLDIPRSCSLAELGTQFDISSNAASERFRRGTKALIENTVYPNDHPT